MTDTTTTGWTRDEYGVVYNSPQTYAYLAERLTGLDAFGNAFGWTDQQGTHMDVLLSVPVETGPFNRTDSRKGKLWIGVAGYGLWAVPPGTHVPGYVAEKLGFGYPNATVVALTDLINGVSTILQKKGFIA